MSERAACALLVLAKAPVAGVVKTRLCPPLSFGQAAELQRRLLWHTLETASRAALGPIELWCAPDGVDPFFDHCRAHFKLELKAQVTGNLGAKMRSALDEGLTRAERAILIGSDCPTITAAYLRQADGVLGAGHDIVLGPAEDGGYGLVGAARALPDMFCNIPWGTPLVMNATLDRLRASGYRWCALPLIWDVDRPEDLVRLASEPQLKILTEGIA
ncbi:MAG: TIGR04282 family arsenosugar biosynthesis glycosyltransferase [Pseudomonadota bacterium]|nr:TIGR04282 family arsenosugar biosynthesis glycosyltransferase [Pseudomonadota bacterium]